MAIYPYRFGMGPNPAAREGTMDYTAKIEALLNKANHPSTPREEAATAAAMAAKLMAKHGLDEAMLRAQRGQDPEAIDAETYDLDGDVHTRALIQALHLIARSMGLQTIRVDGQLVVVGTNSMLDNFAAMAACLEFQMGTAANTATDRFAEDLTAQNPGMGRADLRRRAEAYLRDYVIGFGEGVAEKVKARLGELADEAPGNAIALRTEADRVRDGFNRMFPHRVRGGALSHTYGDAVHAGRAAGRNADIGGTRVSGKTTRAIRR